jgi:adenine phosphoribosyltransferase
MHGDNNIEEIVENRIRAIPDYPKKGVVFRDITPLLKDRMAFRLCIEEMMKRASKYNIDYIAGIEARGFIIGSILAYKMGVGFVPIRKEGKLPYKKISLDYELEYGNAVIEMHKDAIEKGSNVLIVDDLLATGGTANAAAKLIEKTGGNVVGFLFVVELKDLNGRAKLKDREITSIVTF